MEVETPEPKGTSPLKKHRKDQEAVTEDSEHSGSVAGSTSSSLPVETLNSSHSDLSCHGNGIDEEDAMDEEDLIDEIYDSDFDNNNDNDDYMFDDDDDDDGVDDDDDSDYLSMQAQFDNVDLPPGVEASFSWIEKSNASSSKFTPSTEAASADAATLTPAHLATLTTAHPASLTPVHPVSLTPAHPATLTPAHLQTPSYKVETVASCSSVPAFESHSQGKDKEETNDEILKNYKDFKSFDVVDDFSDHHFNDMGTKGEQPKKEWTKKIQDDWRILQKDLPDTIFVRACERRMDLMRAVIVGPQGTPYHDGLFVFDIYFPPSYPQVPPMAHYYAGGLRLNPNLYECGKVCLSLLNTWPGHGSEMWLPNSSTMLQVLVSIQALILNENPFFNEPGFDATYTGSTGEKASNKYSEEVFILSLKTMMYTLRRPPKHFEDLVAGHFRVFAHDILAACKAYLEGAPVGSLVKGNFTSEKKIKNRALATFKGDLSKLMNGLVSNFSRYGAKDCEKFLIQP